MLLTFTGWEGTAEVLGKIRAVRFASDGTLHVTGLTMEEANDALRKLSVGTFAHTTVEQGKVTIALRDVGKDDAPLASVAEPPAAIPQVGTVSPEEYVRVEANVVAEPPEAPTEPEAPPAPAAPEEPAAAEPEPAPEPIAPACETAPAAPAQATLPAEEVSPEQVAADEDETAHMVKHAKQIREVVEYFIGMGVPRTPEALLEVCERWKDKSPLLKKVVNLDARIQRVLQILPSPKV